MKPFHLHLLAIPACILLLLTPAHAAITRGSNDLGAIWFVGDSITQSNADGDPNGSPRKSLYDLLTTAHYTFNYTGSHQANPDGFNPVTQADYTWHSGYSGSMVSNPEHMDGRVDMTGALDAPRGHWNSGRLSTVKPNVILIMLGTNDVDQASRTKRTPGQIAESLGAYVTKIFGLQGVGKPTVFVSTIPPNYRDAETGKRTDAYNAALPAVIAKLRSAGLDVQLVDANRPLGRDRQRLFANILHPNAAGNAVIADTWLKAIVARTK